MVVEEGGPVRDGDEGDVLGQAPLHEVGLEVVADAARGLVLERDAAGRDEHTTNTNGQGRGMFP